QATPRPRRMKAELNWHRPSTVAPKDQRIAGRKINSPSNNTAVKAKNRLLSWNGCRGVNHGRIVNSQRNITTTNRISRIIVSSLKPAEPLEIKVQADKRTPHSRARRRPRGR